MLCTAYDICDAAHGGRYENSGISVMYAVTGSVGVGNVGREFWLQYALKTVAADAWSSVAVPPQFSLTSLTIAEEMDAKLLFLVHTHAWRSVTASGQLW